MIDRLDLTTGLQFHMLRHFTRLDDAYLARFIAESSYSRRKIIVQLGISGSKFHFSFAPNPIAIGEIIKVQRCKNLFSKMESRDRIIYNFTFSQVQYPEGIGICTLVLLEELAPDELKGLRKEKRGRFILNQISGIAPKPTWEMNVVIIRGDKPFISTIFPGTYAPPLPDEQIQGPEEFIFNTDFWNKNALIGQ